MQDPEWKDYQTVFTAAKAGMDGVDKEKVKRIVYEMSKGSAHFKNEQRKQAQVDAKIERLKAHQRTLAQTELQTLLRSTNHKVTELETTRDLSRVWLHVDMDAFYASVEELHNPALARRFGVRSAMPGFIGKRLCPELIFVKPDFDKYIAASKQTRAIFSDFDPEFAAASLDEAYLDATDYCTAHTVTGSQVAEAIRLRMREETGLTCSCGVAANKMLAKVCSDINKPDGQYVLPPSREAIIRFIDTLPVRKIPGIGKVTEQTLGALGVSACRDLMEHRAMLAALFSQLSLDFFLSAALGLGATRHSPPTAEVDPGRKGISCERTFGAMSATAELEAKAEELTKHLAEEMAGEGIEGRTLTLKLKATSFEVRTRAVTLERYSNCAEAMLPAVLKLLHCELPIEIRLMGVRMSNLRKVVRSPVAGTIEHLVRRAVQASPQALAPARSMLSDMPSCTGSTTSLLSHGADTAPHTPTSLAHPGSTNPNEAAPVRALWRSMDAEDAQHGAQLAADPTGSRGPEGSAPGQLHAGAGMQAGQHPQEQHAVRAVHAGHGRARRAPWTCCVCTYASNAPHLLRCEMCDTLKGTTAQDALQLRSGWGVDPPRVAPAIAAASSKRAKHSTAGGAAHQRHGHVQQPQAGQMDTCAQAPPPQHGVVYGCPPLQHGTMHSCAGAQQAQHSTGAGQPDQYAAAQHPQHSAAGTLYHDSTTDRGRTHHAEAHMSDIPSCPAAAHAQYQSHTPDPERCNVGSEASWKHPAAPIVAPPGHAWPAWTPPNTLLVPDDPPSFRFSQGLPRATPAAFDAEAMGADRQNFGSLQPQHHTARAAPGAPEASQPSGQGAGAASWPWPAHPPASAQLPPTDPCNDAAMPWPFHPDAAPQYPTHPPEGHDQTQYPDTTPKHPTHPHKGGIQTPHPDTTPKYATQPHEGHTQTPHPESTPITGTSRGCNPHGHHCVPPSVPSCSTQQPGQPREGDVQIHSKPPPHSRSAQQAGHVREGDAQAHSMPPSTHSCRAQQPGHMRAGDVQTQTHSKPPPPHSCSTPQPGHVRGSGDAQTHSMPPAAHSCRAQQLGHGEWMVEGHAQTHMPLPTDCTGHDMHSHPAPHPPGCSAEQQGQHASAVWHDAQPQAAVACSQCGAVVHPWELGEHQDWHVAMQLQAQEQAQGGHQPSSHRGPTHGGSAKRSHLPAKRAGPELPHTAQHAAAKKPAVGIPHFFGTACKK